MPCWSITTINVNTTGMNADRFMLGLEHAGAKAVRKADGNRILFDAHPELGTGFIDMTTGKIQSNSLYGVDATTVQGLIAQTYARGGLVQQSKRMGWQLKETERNQFEMLKR